MIGFSPVVVTEAHAYRTSSAPERLRPAHPSDRRVQNFMTEQGYRGHEIPEVCGFDPKCRNRIWWPSEEAERRGLGVIGTLLNRSLVSWVSPEL